ncbi:putative thiamine pyrophosphate enzyme TPP binding domain protein [Yellowstone lake phycodnavirus 1]|uniref:putative thiamine pyrophosphate enzyme TPP binding domain protein n=1 Tax=Yellowstone lake phycodnavirus 1 TaxID=1586713 RepID=UPI0006EB5874|nr:putative thiamine pyrophosphate enzyme TPP binding domain protein [Yellowstone lake phycodnavirus 1]BAT22047.1 putative thiamine pyrophosphate enzyme TPP binding domain protein [Yellowstone lake phycodnavirus 1]
MKVSDYVIKFFECQGVEQVFCVSGGAAAHLLESTRTSSMNTIFNYHEQSCAMAADGYARISKKPAIVLVTNGPGSTNTITGVLGAWQDGIPMIILSGQVPRNQTLASEGRPLRQLGVQECNIIKMVEHCTNYAVQLTSDISQTLSRAWKMATTGRMGPVWIDIPIDIQGQDIDAVPRFAAKLAVARAVRPIDQEILDEFARAKKPLIIAGNGIHLACAENEFVKLVERTRAPVICTWNANDLLEWEHPLYVGNFGVFGERSGNLAVQNADCILVLASRLSIPCTGYDASKFAPLAKIIMVDIDENEVFKHTMKSNFQHIGDVKDFIDQFNVTVDVPQWLAQVGTWKNTLSVFNEPHTRVSGFVNSYDMMEELGKLVNQNDIVVTDMGTSFTCTMQALRNHGNRLFTSSGLCSMGFGLPGAIGAWSADKSRRVICIAGDGGFQMNIQELQTVVQYRIPLKIIILNNGGYLAISLMQDNLFKNRFGADISSPNFKAIAQAYGIQTFENLSDCISSRESGLVEMNMVRNQLLIPRVMSYKDPVTQQIKSGTLENMFPT